MTLRALRPGLTPDGHRLDRFQLGEDKAPGAGLQGGTNHCERSGAEFILGVIDNDHSPIGQIADGLVVILAFLDEDEFDLVAHVQSGAHRGG